MNEIEVKILEVDSVRVAEKLQALGAQLLQDTKLAVDWYRPCGARDAVVQWVLRIRSYSNGGAEATWKSKTEIVGITKQVREINVSVADPQAMAELFEAIGLEKYAHQEKFRKSWKLQGWRFDLDQYPNMPAYLEIEGTDEYHIKEAIKLLALEKYKTTAEGERIVIQQNYGLDWFNMTFL